MATPVSQLIEETKRHLYGSHRMSINRLAAGIVAGDTTITLEFDIVDAVRGALLTIDDEILYIISSNAASKQATVIRGFMGTTAATHALAALVEVNPRFPRIYIKRALQQEIDSWGTRLFKVSASNISFSSTTRTYDLGVTNFIDVLSIDFTPYTGRTTRSNPYRWTISRDLDATLYASGSAVEFLGDYPTSGTARVRVSQKFDVSSWTDATDVESLGLSTSMLDIPPIGAAWRLMSTKEVGRTNMQAQPEPRRSEEVPAGHMASVAAQLKKLRDDRIEEERWTLLSRYPLKGVA
jgi:hypothetical protein